MKIITMSSSSNNIRATAILFFWFLLILSVFSLGVCYEGCIKSEREALLNFKLHLSRPSGMLGNWIGDGDCCRWFGVICDNSTGHVIELHLRLLPLEEYIGHSTFYSGLYNEYKARTALSGNISNSLLDLKYLSYLDLSNNDFGGVHIPKFLGSMESLRYLNFSDAGFGGMIPPQLGNISNLQYLNLNSPVDGMYVDNLDWISSLSLLQFLDMSNVNLNKSFNWLNVMNSLPFLLELHLSDCQLSGYPSLVNLNFSNLAILDLSSNHFQGPIPSNLQNLTSFFRVLDLRGNSFNSSIPNWFYSFTHLQLLSLRSNNLQGKLSHLIGNMTSLMTLDLSFNQFEGGIPTSFKYLCNLRSLDLTGVELGQELNHILKILSGCVPNELKSLSLNGCQLFGNFTDNIAHFRNLKFLDLSGNQISGRIPRSFKLLCNLKTLDLSSIQLNQEINDVLEIMSGCISNNVEELDLKSCQLSGYLTNNLGQFKNLSKLRLNHNLVSGSIPESLGEMTSLRELHLDSNKLNGSLPVSFGQLSKLEIANIHGNLLEGVIREVHFANLTKLTDFDALMMRNGLVLRVGPDWIPPLQLQYLVLCNWQIGPQFPSWLRFLKHLMTLDLSNSGISSTIPVWYWDMSSNFGYANLSHNHIHGVIPASNKMNSVIDLSSNNFSGPLPYFSSRLTYLDLSSNSFTGSIVNFLCSKMQEVKNMMVLNLEGNLLSGNIPDCWKNWQSLFAINLSNNKFIGNIPKSIGTLKSLMSLHLSNNNLSGEIQLSLQNCGSLVTLDLSGNKFGGNIPAWIGERFPKMTILNLRANKFHGQIPTETCLMDSLCVLDLARNSLSGGIPNCLNNFSGMIKTNYHSASSLYFPFSGFAPARQQHESIFLVVKGQLMEYSRILEFVRIIDLSDNKLSGEIPMDITSLALLQSLNLSQNSLTGRIPGDIGNMRLVESMDFSQNQLSGNIPESMSNLTFLSHLNLSNNKLTGRIPSGTQLRGFDPSSFMGNELCGPPLTLNCSDGDALPAPGVEIEQDGNGFEVDWFYFFVSLAPGFVVGFWLVVGPLCFNRRWRFAYFHLLDNLWDKIWWDYIKRCWA